MSHFLGRVVADGRVFDETTGLDFMPGAGPLGGPRFVILHFDNVDLSGAATLTVNLRDGVDVFNASSGSDFWSRPVDTSIGVIEVRIVGGTGSARLLEYGSGEPSVTPRNEPGSDSGSQTNPDPFLHTNPYEEPIYETRGRCNETFDWVNAACPLDLVPADVHDRVSAATGMIVEVHEDEMGRHVSSCSGTLIGADLFLTARHCLVDPDGEDVRSASVTFDYATGCDGRTPEGHVTRFFKVIEEAAAGAAADGASPPSADDWVLLRLDAAPGELPAPLRMRDSRLRDDEVIFAMHHPNGAAKKAQALVHDGGIISGFDYAGGSSGSALYDINGALVEGPLSTGGGCSFGYAAVASIREALSNPRAPIVPLDVMIVFDRSGSMSASAPPSGRTKLEEAQDAAALFVQLVREGQGDRLGLVTFSSAATTDTPPGAVADVNTTLVGSAPFTTGQIGSIIADGSTSIGGGVDAALDALDNSANDRAILLLTDGLQNTNPMLESVEPLLGTTKLSVIGFGSDAEIDGALLSRIAREHGGQFTRAVDGRTLRKFFGLSFGNLFEAGALSDPAAVLGADQTESGPHRFDVCGEERITVVLGWDKPAEPLRAHIRTPSGRLIDQKHVAEVRGRGWAFWRVPLPHQKEHDGTWTFTVDRVPTVDEFFVPTTQRYFFLVVCAGGPRLVHVSAARRVYTGDPVDAMVALHYRNRTTPHAQVELTVEAPTVALGQIVTDAGLVATSPDVDAASAFHATLQAVARRAGGVLPVRTSTLRFPLFDDGAHYDGAMEPDGIFNQRLNDLTRVEGTYDFRAVARFGEGCRATREALWSIHVEPGIDPGRTGVTVVDVSDGNDGRQGTLVLEPRDCYGNPLGPGRRDRFTVSPIPGVHLAGKVKDRRDGSYAVDISWDPAVVTVPGVLVEQPDRDPVPLAAPVAPAPAHDCTEPAGRLLDCLGLHYPHVKSVRVTSVCVEINLKDPKCGSDPS